MRTADDAPVGVRVRLARPDDAVFVMEMAPRAAAGAPPWRNLNQLAETQRHWVGEAMQAQREAEAMLVAEDALGRRLGFVYAVPATDFFTGEEHGHVSDIAVAPEAEGRGVGRALMAAAEAWARARGYRALSLHVFVGNDGARAFYERLGYEDELLRMRKHLA
jgi:ribosomal protein S18 acetylase RimI-like enzyme